MSERVAISVLAAANTYAIYKVYALWALLDTNYVQTMSKSIDIAGYKLYT
jgi:hypothetical protein